MLKLVRGDKQELNEQTMRELTVLYTHMAAPAPKSGGTFPGGGNRSNVEGGGNSGSNARGRRKITGGDETLGGCRSRVCAGAAPQG
jgi:hypothetical protein